MKQKLYHSGILFLFYLLIILYLESLFKVRVLSFSLDSSIFRILLFSISYSFMIMFMLMFFKEKTVKRATFILTFIITFLYFNQEIYSSFVEGFYSFTVAGDFTAGLSFFSDYLTAIRFGHITYILPMAALYVFYRYDIINFDIEYCVLKTPLFVLILAFGFFFGSLQTIDEEVNLKIDVDVDVETIDLTELGTLISYSDMDLYTYMYNGQEALKKFGLLTYTQRDFFSIFRGNPLSEQAYSVLIDDYYDKQEGHSSNTYTEIFEDKNLILIMAESLDTFAIHEELTPNLYKLKQDYAYFENFYSPLYYRSTADSEFLVQTSLYPDKNVTLSMEAYMNNSFPNTLPKLFEEKGYSTYSFHNYIDYFYPRGDFHLNALGYNEFWGSEELGLTSGFDPDRVIFDHTWESDYEMMKLAVPKFIEEDRFFVNILTVSGHFQYSNQHEFAKEEYVETVRNYFDNLEEPLDVPDDIIYYLAVHMEVDKAIGYLFEQLEEHNRMDDTVVMIFGDHYAYALDNEDIWEYENEYKDMNDELDIHNVPMMMISNHPLMSGVKDNFMSTVDVMPTIANLFGLDIDYKAVQGNDAMGVGRNIVRFADGSFVSKDFRYDSLSENYTIYDNSVTELYLFRLNNRYVNDYMYNLLILEYDYFREEDD